MATSRKGFPRRYRYYEILGISRDATQEEIRKAFRLFARKYHPDHNPDDREAEAKFKKINEAYQVLSNPTERSAYDTSPIECPVCSAHRVAQRSDNSYECRRCGCRFDSFVGSLSQRIERAAISEQQRVRLTAFQAMQCSWCQEFFTEPFLCAYTKLHSSCFSFRKLSEQERERLLDDEKWWWRIIDLVGRTASDGVIKKCTRCRMLNPNPEKRICWNCGHNIYDRCPSCGLPTLYFDLSINLWKCSNCACSEKRFDFGEGKGLYARSQMKYYEPSRASGRRCPNCGHDLYYDAASQLWTCGWGHTFYAEQLMRRDATHTEQERKTYESRQVAKGKCPNCGRNLYFDPGMGLWTCSGGHAFYVEQSAAKQGKKSKLTKPTSRRKESAIKRMLKKLSPWV